jgi:hypothetical protein
MAPAGAKARKQESSLWPSWYAYKAQPARGPPDAKIPFRFLRICFLPTGQSGTARAFRFPFPPPRRVLRAALPAVEPCARPLGAGAAGAR